FRELRADLLSRGYPFGSATDGEVLLHGYREWGVDGLVARLRGMYAFGLWDAIERKLYLVRDRLGVKPLLYSVRDGALAFASTARGLRAGGFAGDIDEHAVAEFLHFGFITDARCIYGDVVKVPAGSIVEYTGGAPQTRRYWLPPSVDRSCELSFADAVDETE